MIIYYIYEKAPSSRGAHRNRTIRAGRDRTTDAVPVPFHACSNHLDGRCTGRSRPV